MRRQQKRPYINPPRIEKPKPAPLSGTFTLRDPSGVESEPISANATQAEVNAAVCRMMNVVELMTNPEAYSARRGPLNDMREIVGMV
jgi:hypothetical protein